MKLNELLSYDKITIQCHNNPDADTIASAFALYQFFFERGADVRIVYCGNRIVKPNLNLMISKLNIPIINLWDTQSHVDGLLLLVDCQYGESNVTRLSADVIAEIDHHNTKGDVSLVDYVEIQPQLGACSTLVWKLLKNQGFFDRRHSIVETALYYGLMTDTENFIEAHHPLDLDMRDELDYDKMIISNFINSNISIDELKIAGIALIRNIYNGMHRYSVAHAEPCDPNVMGMIIDLIKTVDTIDSCVIFNESGNGFKFSVRSCSEEIHANELAEYISEGIGSAGGHYDKAGGFCDRELFKKLNTETEFETYINNRMKDYFNSVEKIVAAEYNADLSEFKKYRKREIVLGYVDPAEFIPNNTRVLIRTLEGDVNCVTDGSFYIMIGVLGEVYPIKKEKFEKNYTPVSAPYECDFEYDPVLHTNYDGKKWELVHFAKSCRVSERSEILAKPLDGYAKVFTEWDYDNYMYGHPGDYLACRVDDPHDIYIIRKDIFVRTYEDA